MQSTAIFGLLTAEQAFYTTKVSQLVIKDDYKAIESYSSASGGEEKLGSGEKEDKGSKFSKIIARKLINSKDVID